ncbi:hypothetical protein ACFL4T_05640 [candidate division KSB1 bacterium]
MEDQSNSSDYSGVEDELFVEVRGSISFDQIVSLTMIAETVLTIAGIGAYAFYLAYQFVVGS